MNREPHDNQSPVESGANASHSGRGRARAPRSEGAGMRLLRPLLSRRSRPVSPLLGETEQYKGTVRHLILSGLLLTIILSLVMTVSLVPGQVDIQPGMPAGQDIFSPVFLRYESVPLTKKAREEAMNAPANDVWVQDTAVVQEQRATLLAALSVVDSVRGDETLPSAIQRQRLRGLQGITLTDTLVDSLLTFSDTEYQYWRNSGVMGAFDKVMGDNRLASSADVERARSTLGNVLVPALNPEQRAAAIAFISPLIAINVRLDPEQTQQRRLDAAANVKPVTVSVQKGEVILRQGELATAEAIEKMQEAGLLTRNLSLASVAGTSGIVGLLMLLLHLYIYRYAPFVWRRQKQLLLVGLLIITTITMARVFLPGHELLPYFLPVAAVSMLIAVLISANLAVLVTFVLSVLLGMVVSNGLSMELTIYYIVGGLTGIFTLTRIEKVSTFGRAGLSITAVSFIAALLVKVVTGATLDWAAVGLLLLAAGLNGGMSTSIAYAAFALLGTLFGITTPLQLMELAHPDQPVLRRLMREAPGTYHHSLVVSNLAERAAEMVGADALLTRVCAYYHDIGKVERPYYFIDNQSGMGNVHDQMNPRASATIIAEHVLDGVRLGQKYNLPRRVLDAIPQHHGTMLIKYFYVKALQEDPNTNPEDFRYPGPKPQTKENAILMLADGVEATVRSMAQSGALDKMAAGNSDATEGSAQYNNNASLPEDAIAGVVHKVIAERIEDGQLDECDLTVRDIARIQEAFVSMLKGIYHPRVVYPDAPRKEAEQPAPAPATPITAPTTSPLEAPAPANGLNGASLNLQNGPTPNGQNGAIKSLTPSNDAEPQHERHSPTSSI
ncbi:MAG TPA: HDIG domain-containing protein [Chloroflexia bacterium]|nr:HDIG domain-containing protein [Chloroflexia bacterium]